MTNSKNKTVFFFARSGELIKLKANKHSLVTGFLAEREKQIIRWYRKHIADEFMTCFPEYTLPKADFERVQKELQIADLQVVIFLHDMFHPIVHLKCEKPLTNDVPNQ